MSNSAGRESGNVAVSLIILFSLCFVLIPLILHWTQRAHNELPFQIGEAFPPDQPFVPGEIYASTVIAIIDHELSSRSGWRPNDFPLWGHKVLADNNANRQIGIIQALRESVRVFRDHLTKVSATEVDDRLRQADNRLRIDETKFWFPSAEGEYRKAIGHLKQYLGGLRTDPQTSKPINRRNVEVIRLFQAWTDLLGNAHANLIKEREPGEGDEPGPKVSFFKTDDYYYQAQGYAHVMFHLMQALRREYAGEIANRPGLDELFRDVTRSLGRAAVMKPVVVLNGPVDGLRANHRRNLSAFIVDARQKMYSIREELEK